VGKDHIVHGGRFYWRSPQGPLEPAAPGDPDVWICRRVADYPSQQIPMGGQVAACTRCEAPIVFNPARPVSAPKICMQCARITPLPLEN
jgi:hypothetical protein